MYNTTSTATTTQKYSPLDKKEIVFGQPSQTPSSTLKFQIQLYQTSLSIIVVIKNLMRSRVAIAPLNEKAHSVTKFWSRKCNLEMTEKSR